MNAGSMADLRCGAEARCELCPLTRVQTGVAVRIRQLCAKPEIQARLRELGLCEDQVVRLITSGTSFICQVCNTRLALSEQLASLILVEPMQPVVVSSR
jgi:Fe2+ transport system protein FeoA